MSRIVLLTLLYLITLHCWGKGNVTFTTKDSARIVRLLTTAKKLSPSPTSWTLYFARQFVGTPYVGGTLDRAREERLVINLPELDCTTYVEQVLALARCAELGSTSFGDFCEQLRHIRYVGGEIAYVKRQHYFTGWIEDNENELIVKEIQLPNPPVHRLDKRKRQLDDHSREKLQDAISASRVDKWHQEYGEGDIREAVPLYTKSSRQQYQALEANHP